MTPDATAHQRTEHLDQFRNFTMAHPRLVEARDELVDAIEGATPGGKTTLRTKVEQLLLQQMPPDSGRLPFVSVEVPPGQMMR